MHSGHCWRSKDEFISNFLQCTPALLVNQQKFTSFGSVQTLDAILKTCLGPIDIDGERESKELVVVVCPNDDDIHIYIYPHRDTYKDIYIYVCVAKELNKYTHTHIYIYIYVCMQMCIYSTPLPQAGCNRRSIFKWNFTGLNSGFLIT